jgi:putative glutamine amidotransferase
MLPGYLDGISEAGGLPIIFPLSADEQELRQLFELCDGVLLTGGHDVSPVLYHEEPLEGLVECCRKRDEMEGIIFKMALEDDVPVLGICRGIQFINAALGGTLYQDLPLQHPSAVDHHQKAPYDVPAHEVQIVKDSPLYKCLSIAGLPVNSCHHQGIRELAPGLEIWAQAPDGLVEAICLPGKRYVRAVQWHPEFFPAGDPLSEAIFESFVAAAKENM